MSEDNNKVMLEESHVGEKGSFGGKIISSQQGKIKKKTVLPFCYVCGKKLGEDSIICEECGNPCCSDSIVNFDGISRCIKCLKEKFPKRNFKVLCCIPLSKKDIHKLTKIPKEEIELSLIELQLKKLIVKKGLVFKHLELTDVGTEILHLYSQVYVERDVQELKEQLIRIKGGVRIGFFHF